MGSDDLVEGARRTAGPARADASVPSAAARAAPSRDERTCHVVSSYEPVEVASNNQIGWLESPAEWGCRSTAWPLLHKAIK